MRTRVSVNSNVIRSNKKHGTDNPPIRIAEGRKIRYAREVRVGAGTFVYAPDRPLSCGARLYFETDEPVQVVA